MGRIVLYNLIVGKFIKEIPDILTIIKRDFFVGIKQIKVLIDHAFQAA